VVGGALAFWARLPAAFREWPRVFLVGVALVAFATSIALYRLVEKPAMERFRRLRPRASGA